jgi:hypothetical protein
MLRKTLLAATVGVLISPVAMAGDINSQTDKAGWTNEALGLAGTGDVVTGEQLAMVLGAEFAVNDVVTLGFSGDALDDTTVPTTVTAACGGGLSGITFGLLSATNNSAQFRVTELDTTCGANTTVGQTVVIAAPGALEFDPAAVAANGGVTVTYSAETNNGLPLDTSSGPVIPMCTGFNCNARSTPYIQTAAQFGVITDDAPAVDFDAIVDVNTQRTAFDPPGSDTGRFDASNNDTAGAPDTAFEGVDVAYAVTPTGHSPTFTGNFGWITDTDENTEGVQPGPGVVTLNGGCANLAVTATEITAEDCGLLFAELILDPTAQAPDLTVLPATSFQASTVIAYDDAVFANGADGTLDTGLFGLGAWVLNGFQAEVAYMPFQTGIGQVIYFANRSSQTGEISVDWIDQNANSGTFTIGDSVAGSTRAIGPAIQAGLPAAQQEGGRLALTITVNVPACDGQLNAQYNVNGDRAFSVSTTNCTP